MIAPSAPLRVAVKRGLFSLSLRPVVLLAAFIAILFFFRLDHRELYSSHEARAAQNAQRMLDTGEWGVPVLFDGQADLQKPPGYYWLVAIAGWLNGGTVTALEARLPAALAGLWTVLMVFTFLKSEGRPTAAWIAAIALTTAIHFTSIARTARIDVPLTCAVTGSLLAFAKSLASSRQTAWVLISAAAAACGVMLKGPIALALIGPTAIAWLIVRPREAGESRWALSWTSLLVGAGTVLALAAPWFFWANHATRGEFFRVFFWHHNFERFAGTSPTLASHPWWYYVPRFAADFLPWTPALVFLIALRSASRLAGNDPVFRFGTIWFATMFLVLSAAQFKRADYLLPLYPGAAIALGCAAEAWLATRTNPRTIRAAKWMFGIAAAGSLAGWQVMTFAIEPADQAKEEKRAFAAMIRAHAPPPHQVMLFRTEPHSLAFYLGRPLLTRVEWHDLNDWLAQPGPHFVVMPPEYVYPALQIVRSRRLVEVARLEDYTSGQPPRPLVFLRTE
jgi:4-amino-4-deoxy-L-arabinose transferase-like glycosyltransferase